MLNNGHPRASLVAQSVKNAPAVQETPVQFLGWKTPWRRDNLLTPVFLALPCGPAGKESACNVGGLGLIPELGRFTGEGKGYLLQYSGLENSMDCMHSPWGRKQSDAIEELSLLQCFLSHPKRVMDVFLEQYLPWSHSRPTLGFASLIYTLTHFRLVFMFHFSIWLLANTQDFSWG